MHGGRSRSSVTCALSPLIPKVSEIKLVNAVKAFDGGRPLLSFTPFIESTVNRMPRHCQLRVRAMLCATHSAASIRPNCTRTSGAESRRPDAGGSRRWRRARG
jgi:hypothetical protein